ncbi:MAG: sugar ABC transporter permease [Lachnospiraceae bacterium]|nr:sugar ABC transporter permease [Lachnospiraceae bacterium]
MKVIEVTEQEQKASAIYIIQRILSILMVMLVFVPGINPARITELINKNVSLFTSAVSYSTVTSQMGRAFTKGWLAQGTIVTLYIGSVLLLLGLLVTIAATAFSVGNLKCKRTGNLLGLLGSALSVGGLGVIGFAFWDISQVPQPQKVNPMLPKGFIAYCVLVFLYLVSVIITFAMVPKPSKKTPYRMESAYKLFLMFAPFAALCFVFSYLPLWGWRYAFFDYSAGQTLTWDKFVGFKWFTSLFQSSATRNDVVRVLRNTLIMSGLGIATSWCPMAFAIFLCEIKNMKFRRVIQTFTTIPNFISWVMVYAIAFAIFSTDGFINTFLSAIGSLAAGQTGVNYLMGNSAIWLKMLLWGMWKGIGWSAIIYIAGISGIDQQLYEAATVDGAGRFARMWHVTVPGLMPTYFVMLLMSIANILSNGMDQYLVFENTQNKATIEVLDLYVYYLGIGNGNIPLSTVVGMVKSLVSVILLFVANRISKSIRGESIV